MSKIEQSAVVYRCDNPSCQATRVDLDGGKPDGYHLPQVELVFDNGDAIDRAVDVFACSAKCIRPAIEAMVNTD